MPKLPFVVEPKPIATVRIGNEEIGELEIRKLEDLSPNERVWIRERMKQVPDMRKEAVRLAREIADRTERGLLDVYDALTSGNTAYLQESLEDVLDFQSNLELSIESKKVIYATAVLRFRVEPEWDVEHTGDPDLIHPKLVSECFQFALKEEAHWEEEDQELETPPELTEEDLGKS